MSPRNPDIDFLGDYMPEPPPWLDEVPPPDEDDEPPTEQPAERPAVEDVVPEDDIKFREEVK